MSATHETEAVVHCHFIGLGWRHARPIDLDASVLLLKYKHPDRLTIYRRSQRPK